MCFKSFNVFYKEKKVLPAYISNHNPTRGKKSSVNDSKQRKEKDGIILQ